MATESEELDDEVIVFVPENYGNVVDKKDSEAERVAELEDCCVCCEPIQYMALGKCDHKKACAECFLRRKILYNDNRCPLCKASLDSVVMTSYTDKPFAEFDVSSFAEDFVIDLEVQTKGVKQEFKVFVDGDKALEQFTRIEKLWQVDCPVCDQEFNTMVQLKKHVKERHKLSYCDLCLADRKVFLREQKLYSDKEMSKHLRVGDKDVHIKHEFCKFCKKNFYDSDQLYHHLQEAHETCFICDSNGKQYQYYTDYASLEHHFKTVHYMCSYQQCLEKKFIVFKTADDLKLHQLEEHGKKKWESIDLRFGLDDLPRNSSSSNPDVKYLCSLFPSVNMTQVVEALNKANGDLDVAAEALLQYGPLAPAQELPKKEQPKKAPITMPTGKAVTVVLGAPKLGARSNTRKSFVFDKLDWTVPPNGLLTTEILPYLDLFSVVNASRVCTAWYREASDQSIWKSFCLRFFSHLYPESHVKLFKGWKHMTFALMSRKRICPHCKKTFVDFTNKLYNLCKYNKRNGVVELLPHKLSGNFILSKQIVLQCNRPSEDLRKVRGFLHSKSLAHKTFHSSWAGQTSFILTDPNTGLEFTNSTDALAYINFMYNTSSGAEHNSPYNRWLLQTQDT